MHELVDGVLFGAGGVETNVLGLDLEEIASLGRHSKRIFEVVMWMIR